MLLGYTNNKLFSWLRSYHKHKYNIHVFHLLITQLWNELALSRSEITQYYFKILKFVCVKFAYVSLLPNFELNWFWVGQKLLNNFLIYSIFSDTLFVLKSNTAISTPSSNDRKGNHLFHTLYKKKIYDKILILGLNYNLKILVI